MPKNNARRALAAAVIATASAAHAQTVYVRPMYQYPETPPATGPSNVQLGDSPVFLTSHVGAALGHDDNLFLAPTDEKGSNVYLLTPGVKLDARDANKVLQASYQAQVGRYTSSRDDDYVDHTARAQFDMAVDRRNFLRFGYDYLRSHDPRGSTDRPVAGEPDRYRETSPYFMYALGSPGAEGRLELYYSDPSRRYISNRQFTAASDRDMQEFGGAFYWRVLPRTYVMAEARETNVRYVLPGSPLSADERRYYAGVMWEATAATTGTVKVGQLKRDFKDPEQTDFSGTSWEALVTWAPRTYSKFDFYSARLTNESTGLGDFILTSVGGVTWSHSWTTYVTTAVDARYQKDDYQAFDRNDRTAALGLKAGYRFRRWLTLGAEYTHVKRDSNIDVFHYKRNLYFLTLTATL
jgi:polysaccharide biosynthesis protein VpsM